MQSGGAAGPTAGPKYSEAPLERVSPPTVGRFVSFRPDWLRVAWFVTLLFYALFLTAFHYAATMPWWLASPERMANFSAAEPFQHRLLMPLIASILKRAIPPLNVDVIFAMLEVGLWMLLVIVACRALERFRIGHSDTVRRYLALTIVIPVAMHLIVPELKIPSLFIPHINIIEFRDWGLHHLPRYVYDLPAAVFILALVVLLKRFTQHPDRSRFAAYLGLFALATLNRETTIFLIPAFAVCCFGIVDRGTLAKTVAAQLIVFAIVLVAAKIFSDGAANLHQAAPGTDYQDHLTGNLSLLTNPLYLLIYAVRFAAGLYLPVILMHRHLDQVLKRTLLCFGLPLLASAVLVGRLQEERVVIEIVPLIWLAALQAITAAGAERQKSGSCRAGNPDEVD